MHELINELIVNMFKLAHFPHADAPQLYNYRCILFSVICNQNKSLAWKSKLHEDNTMFENMFIVGINTPMGQATYHCEKEYWDLFDIKEVENAPKWDGHTPTDVLERLQSLVNISKEDKTADAEMEAVE